MVRWCWVNFQCQGVLLIWIRVGQGPAALAVGAGGDCLDIFTLVYHFYFLSPSLWETAKYRLKYCLKGPLSRKQPTNQIQLNKANVSDTETLFWEKRLFISGCFIKAKMYDKRDDFEFDIEFFPY